MLRGFGVAMGRKPAHSFQAMRKPSGQNIHNFNFANKCIALPKFQKNLRYNFLVQRRFFGTVGDEEDLLPVPLLEPDSTDANSSFHHPFDVNQEYIDQEVQTAELSARNTYSNNYRVIGLGLSEMGTQNLFKKKYFKAESYYLRAYANFEKASDYQSMSHVNLALGKAYLEMGQYDKVVATCEKNLVLLKLVRFKKKANGLNKNRDILPTLMMLEKALEEKQDFKRAEATLAQLLEEYKKIADPPVFLGEIYIKIGQMHQSNRKFKKAQKAFEQALTIHEYMWGAQHPIVATSFSCLGRLKLEEKKYKDAKQFIDQALRIREMNSQKIGQPMLPVPYSAPGSELAPAEALHWDPFIRGSSYEDLAMYHEALGEYEEALAARKKQLEIISSLNIPSFATFYLDHPKIPFLNETIKVLEDKIAKKTQKTDEPKDKKEAKTVEKPKKARTPRTRKVSKTSKKTETEEEKM